MVFYKLFILILTFILLNVPIFIFLYRSLLKDLNLFSKLVFTALYWSVVFLIDELAPFIGVLVLIFKVHRKEDNGMQARDINIWSISFRDFLLVTGAAFIFKGLIDQINNIYVKILIVNFRIKINPQNIVSEFGIGDTYEKIWIFILVVILAPFVEEYVFRYYMYDRLLLPRMPSFAAGIISTAFFTLMHLNVSGIPTFLFLGLYCTLIYERKGYFAAVITHMVSNLFTVILLI